MISPAWSALLSPSLFALIAFLFGPQGLYCSTDSWPVVLPDVDRIEPVDHMNSGVAFFELSGLRTAALTLSGRVRPYASRPAVCFKDRLGPTSRMLGRCQQGRSAYATGDRAQDTVSWILSFSSMYN